MMHVSINCWHIVLCQCMHVHTKMGGDVIDFTRLCCKGYWYVCKRGKDNCWLQSYTVLKTLKMHSVGLDILRNALEVSRRP